MVNIHAAEDPLQKQCPAFERKPEPYTMHGSGRNKQLNGRNEGKPPVGGSEHSLLTIGSRLLIDRPVFPLAVPIEIFVTYILLDFSFVGGDRFINPRLGFAPFIRFLEPALFETCLHIDYVASFDQCHCRVQCIVVRRQHFAQRIGMSVPPYMDAFDFSVGKSYSDSCFCTHNTLYISCLSRCKDGIIIRDTQVFLQLLSHLFSISYTLSKRVAHLSQCLAFIAIERADEIVVAVIVAVPVLLVEATPIGGSKHSRKGAILSCGNTRNRVSSGFCSAEFHHRIVLCAPAFRQGARLSVTR